MGNGIFSGLEDLGLDLTSDDIFKSEADGAGSKKGGQGAKKEVKEEDFLFDKTYECPICGTEFKERTLRTGKARLLKTDIDLRPTFEGIEPLKYDVVHCPHCGYTALTRFFGPMTNMQKKNIIEKICAHYCRQEKESVTYTYEEAIGRYKLALANAMVRMAKTSEKAYICLRSGWLVRSYMDELEKNSDKNAAKIKEMKALETEFIKNAYEGFIAARESESFPMCGMDETTLDYLIATLAIRFDQLGVASKLIASILYNPSCNARIKDKARDLKDEVLRLKKAKKDK